MKYKSIALGLLLSPCWASGLLAQNSSLPSFDFSGFGTLGVIHSSEDRADYRTAAIQPNGAGYTYDWAFGGDTRLGVQLTGNLTERLTGVVQVVSELTYENNYEPTIEWANLKYDFTPELSLRIGRTVVPTFMVSDYRKVGYANPWVRPPIEVYGLVPITSNDGADLNYRFQVGKTTNNLKIFTGGREFDFPDAGTFESKDFIGAFHTLEVGSFTFGAGFQQGKLDAPSINELFGVFRMFGPEGVAIADRYDLDDTRLRLWTLGANYDPGAWFLRTEITRVKSRSMLGANTAWYFSGGYRLGEFTPYAGYGQRRKTDSTSSPGVDVTTLPPPLQGLAFGLNGVLSEILRPNDYQTISLGTRWDFMLNVSLKVQFDHIRLDDNSQGDLINPQPGFQRGGEVNLFSATIDFLIW